MREAATPEMWMLAGLEKLAERGIEAVKVEVLARVLGVTKGSFYWHFADRAALLHGMLAVWERRGTLDLIAAAQGSGASPADQLRALSARAFGGKGNLERALRAWAAHDDRAAEVLSRVDRQRLRYMTELMRAHGLPPDDAEARSRFLYAAFVGELQLTVSLPSRKRLALALSALDTLLK